MISPLEVLDLYKEWDKGIFNIDIESLEKAAEQYKTTGIAVLEDILNVDVLEAHHNFLSNEMPEWWWNINYFYYEGSTAIQKYKANTAENREEAIPHKANVWKALTRGGFSYTYKRTIENHFETCDCNLCSFQNKFYKQLKYVLSYISGKNLNRAECFTSKYEEGDFNGFHHDNQKGELAFILHITKGWKPGYGGEFMSFSDDGSVIEACIPPSFNKLVMMKLNRGEDKKFKNHMVTRVNAADWHRLSISGWWNEDDS